MKKEESKGGGSGIKAKVSEFFLHMISYGGFNVDDGVIHIWGDPSLFMPLQAYTTLYKELEKALGTKVNDEIFYYLGRLYGKNSTIMMMKKYGISKKDVPEFVNGATQDGFGYMKIKWYDADVKLEGEVSGSNAMFAINYRKKFGKSKKSVDSYMRGILAGGTEPLFDLPLDVEEKKCMAKGDKECLYHFSKKDVKPFSFFKKTKINETNLNNKTRSMALKRKGKLKFLRKKNIKFGDGAFILEGVTGVNIPVYGFVILNEILNDLIGEKKKIDIYKKMANDYIQSIKSKITGVDLKIGLSKLEIFGLGKYNLTFSGNKRLIIENGNCPCSIDYKSLFGRSKSSKEEFILLILESMLAESKVKTKIEQKTSISQGKSKNTFMINILN